MRILIAEDDATSQLVLQRFLTGWGYEVVVTANGREALDALLGADAPRIAVLDWMMPELDGVDVCRRLREAESNGQPTYVILLTALDRKSNIVEGLEAGADDYLIKPFDKGELHARLQVGERVVGLQADLAQRVADLEEALGQIRRLEGIIPICSYCHRVRKEDSETDWGRLEQYIEDHSDAFFSHGICPQCYTERFADDLGPR